MFKLIQCLIIQVIVICNAYRNSSTDYEFIDIPVSDNNFYIFNNLPKPCQNYTISVCMRNGVGEGPSATVYVQTLNEPAVKDTQKPVLILGAHHTVIRQEDMLDEPTVLFKTKDVIKGLAIHVARQLLFLSVSTGHVYCISMIDTTKQVVVLTPQNLKFQPFDLSVDWLNEQLYILGEVSHSSKSKVWQITRCNLDGSGLTVAVAGLLTKPHKIEIDPYNGFLFWVLDGTSRAGLYRLDLSDISNGVKHEVRPELIFESAHLGAFTVDYTNFQLLVPDHSKNTVYSVSLDGREVIDLRSNTQQPMFYNVLSLSVANGLFYWTNGDTVLAEEYHPGQNSYYHNAYPDLNYHSYIALAMNLPSSQPVPVPVNPPTSVQAILGANIAKTSWQIPQLLGGQGKGSWQNWSYELHVNDITHVKTMSYRGINTTSFTIKDLEENTEYIFKAAAYTTSGTGPWSSEFRGKTLKKSTNKDYPSILWSASEGLLKSDMTGDNVKTLMHKMIMKDYYIVDITWYQDVLYLVSNTSQLYWYNMTSHERGKLHDLDSVDSIAVDWLGKKLYWSNPKQQLIIRSNLNGTQHEYLHILTVGKELNVDSVNAYIYWSTGHSVHYARLNGQERDVYHPVQPFSGKQVMGLTLDTTQDTIYWIVRSYESTTLYKDKMAHKLVPGTKPSPIKVSNLQRANMEGPLCYFSDHLLWLQDDRNAVIGDMIGQNAAVINEISLSGLTMVSIYDPSLHVLPNNSNSVINVIPEAVSPDSVRIEGNWESFNITWKHITNVNYGNVFYEVKINNVTEDKVHVTTTPYILYWNKVLPYTKLDISIRAGTYWGFAQSVRVQLDSPSSPPTEPRNARCFVSYKRYPFYKSDTELTFRWNTPEKSNGIIAGYQLNCWYRNGTQNIEMCNDAIVDKDCLEYTLQNVIEEEIFYFQVRAFTNAGNGQPSPITACDTGREYPIPQMLIASSDSIFKQDFDTNTQFMIVRNTMQPIYLTYHFNEKKIFWLNELQELFMSNVDGTNKTKYLTLNGVSNGLTIDWVERCLYFVKTDVVHFGSSILKLDLNKVDRGYLKIETVLTIPNRIVNIEVSPFTRSIYWMEIDHSNNNVLMQANTDGTNIKYFFERNRHSYKRANNNEYLPCSCPNYEFIENVFTLTHSESKPSILFIDFLTKDIVLADQHGCDCDVISSNQYIKKSHINKFSVNDNNIYWSNSTDGYIYSIKRNMELIVVEFVNGSKFTLWGSHIQPLPPSKCLSPQQTPLNTTFYDRTSDSITLRMPDIKVNESCEGISIATVQYSVYYMPYNEQEVRCDESCSKLVTFEKTLRIGGLRPFSKYMFSVVVGNFYSDLQGIVGVIGPAVVYQTAAGAPSKPQNVTATVLNPTMVEVKWLPPHELNGDKIWYEIHWQTEKTVDNVRQKGEQIVSNKEDKSEADDVYRSVELQKFAPNQTYLIWVRAYSENPETYTDSNSIQVHTYAEPNDIVLVNRTAYTLDISWNSSQDIEKWILQYTDIISNNWKDVTNDSRNNVKVSIDKLEPKMKYKFRLALKYLKYTQLYIWPLDSRFVFETLGDRPSKPGVPVIQHVKADVYQILWEASKENGAPIELYNLEGLGVRKYRVKRSTNRSMYNTAPPVEDQDEEWISYYNGTETYWIISGLNAEYRYSFRVTSLNSYGWSDPSDSSTEFDLSAAARLAERHEQLEVILGISITAISAIIICICICCVYLIRKKEKEKKTAQSMLVNRPVSPDVELATLRELPRRDNFIHNTNALYVSALPTAEELALLPQINRDQITLINFLGRGAFGEVYEGKAKRLGTNGSDINVAVKTLRKGATEQEKLEFLQEAQLMSHFKHRHILQLLGVCLDTHFIIMELMQGGDLLTYLRTNRTPKNSGDALTILDLLSMCVDVACGCQYLEEMHFVHRDLACRNCLVSSTDRQSRVVKIGDFGLARDIYKNDYYRKEGEGLLPVRWMAPESLVDGVFTCQSDVWAFGVLIWEIMTLGQQPYPARTNLEVLHYVKGGGRLEKPVYCPEELHRLMMSCWSYQPENRPTFKYCLEVLEEQRSSTTDSPLMAANNGNYISTLQNVPNGVSNYAYFHDENHNSSGSSWKTDGDENKDQVPLVQTLNNKNQPLNVQIPQEIPKYLEIICDGCEPTCNDGYEIPRSSVRSTKSDKLTSPEYKGRVFPSLPVMGNGNLNSVKACEVNKNGLQKNFRNSGKVPDKGSYGNMTTQPLLENSSEDTSIESQSTCNGIKQPVC